MNVKFCGAAREVTGSCHLVTLENGFKILLDCGLYQGRDNTMRDFNSHWLFNPAEIDAFVLSHAHIDHTGRIPKLVKDGFKGMIYATHATRDLSAIMLLDSGRIQEKDAEYQNQLADRQGRQGTAEPLYSTQDVGAALKLFVAQPYDVWFNIHPDVQVRFADAGHILGSASIALYIKEGGKTVRLGFSGDIGRPNRPILRDPASMPDLDFLLCESTYGDREHPSAPEETDKFLQIIQRTCVERGGKLMIPAFSVGRTQEIVYMLDKIVEANHFPSIPVFVDSPLAVDATEVFIKHPECFDDEMNRFMLTDPNPFGFKNLTYIRSVDESKKLNDLQGPCVIISASGMANAGRIQHHLYNNIENPKNTVLIAGYCSPETPGGRLRAGADHIILFGESKAVRAEVVVMDSLSAHGDRKEIVGFLSNEKNVVKKIFLVHGDYDTQQAFVKYLGQNGFPNVEIPALGDTAVITVGADGALKAELQPTGDHSEKPQSIQREEGSGE